MWYPQSPWVFVCCSLVTLISTWDNDSSMTCCCGRPRRREISCPTAGRALRRYLSDKQSPPPSRGAEHVAKCRPELLTPHNGSEGPRNRRDGREWASWRLTVISIITAAPDFPVARLQEWTRPFLRMTDHLQTQIVVLEAAPTWETKHRTSRQTVIIPFKLET